MDLPRLPRQLVRPELLNAPLEKEIWRPSWKCFCCQDKGLVNANLVRLIISDYKAEEDKPVACQRRSCEAGEAFHGDSVYDQRFTSLICIELDKISRKDWDATVLTKWEQAKNRQKLEADLKVTASDMNLRQRDRTPVEHQYAQAKHQEVVTQAHKEEVAVEVIEF